LTCQTLLVANGKPVCRIAECLQQASRIRYAALGRDRFCIFDIRRNHNLRSKRNFLLERNGDDARTETAGDRDALVDSAKCRGAGLADQRQRISLIAMSFSFAYQSRIFPHGIVDLGQFPRFRSHKGALGRTPIQTCAAATGSAETGEA